MAKMKTLTVSGQTYTVNDPEAVSFAQMQELTHLQQQTARENIGACTVEQTVDRLCPPFSEADTVVTCRPVEGYPLAAVSRIVPKQDGTGDPSPDNIRPISGHTAVKLTRCGKNLLPKVEPRTETENGTTLVLNEDGSVSISGMPTTNSSIYLTESLSVEHLRGKQITVNHNVGENVYLAINLSYNDGTSKSYNWLRGNRAELLTKVVPNNAKQIDAFVVVLTDFDGNPTTFYPQLELGSTPTAFEASKGETFTFDLGQTVYGGCLDWATGVLTITDKGVAMKDLSWLKSSQGFFQATRSDGAVGDVNGVTIQCNTYTPSKNYHGIDNNTATNEMIMGSSYFAGEPRICVCDLRFTTTADFKAHLESSGAFLVYPLAEPVTVQLTPQEILALSGVNMLYSDTGDTCVTGKADPVAIIEKLTNAIIALGGNV